MTAQEILARLLQAHDLKITEYNDWLLPDGEMPAICALTQGYREQNGKASIRLDIGIALDKDKMIWESFAGLGMDELTATQNAFENFVKNSFHVMLSALWDITDGEQVGVEEWEIGGQTWKATIGNFGCKGKFDVPQELFATIEDMVSNLDFNGEIHWLRVFYANVGKDETIIECLLDNEVWEDGRRELQTVNWLKSDSFYSIRNFIIFQKV